jgi:hypothetical protein
VNNPIYPSWAQQVAFIDAMLPVLEGMPFLERYAWFALPPDQVDSTDTTALYNSDGTPTQSGSAYSTF